MPEREEDWPSDSDELLYQQEKEIERSLSAKIIYWLPLILIYTTVLYLLIRLLFNVLVPSTFVGGFFIYPKQVPTNIVL